MFGGIAIVAVHTALRPDWLSIAGGGWIWMLFGIAALVQCVLVLIVAPSMRLGRLTLRHVPDVLPYLWYGLRWTPVAVALLTATGYRATWSRTEHARALSMTDVERNREFP